MTAYSLAPRPALTASTVPAVPIVDAIDRERPFTIVPAVHQSRIVNGSEDRQTWRSAVANRLYITRKTGHDLFGPTPAIPAEKMNDLGEHGRRGPIGCDSLAVAGMELWRKADDAAAIDRPELPVCFHAVGWLPLGMDDAGWRNIIHAFCDDVLVRNGMVADWAVHRRPDEQGSWAVPPHAHLIITARGWRPERNPGRRNAAWLGSISNIKAASDAWLRLLMVVAGHDSR